MDARATQPILDVQRVTKWFPVRRGVFRMLLGYVQAVTSVSFTMQKGEILGLVGESGCGKSTLARIILHLQKTTAGRVLFEGKDWSEASRKELKAFRRQMQIVFQDPYSSLNPRMSVGAMLREVQSVHDIVPPEEIPARTELLLNVVGLNTFHANRYPHEFSSGQRQRIGIARALAVRPRFIVCDEPVSALDVSIQAQIINLLMDLQQKYELTYLFISHDLSVVRHISDRIAVMYLGRIVEIGPADEVTSQPLHPYTQALIASAPVPDPRRSIARVELKGEVPSPISVPPGCPFHTRCPQVFADCLHVTPQLNTVVDDHSVSCLLYEESWPKEIAVPQRVTETA